MSFRAPVPWVVGWITSVTQSTLDIGVVISYAYARPKKKDSNRTCISRHHKRQFLKGKHFVGMIGRQIKCKWGITNRNPLPKLRLDNTTPSPLDKRRSGRVALISPLNNLIGISQGESARADNCSGMRTLLQMAKKVAVWQ